MPGRLTAQGRGFFFPQPSRSRTLTAIALYEEGFVSRISRYNAGIYWICQRRVMTLAVLADLRRGWVPDEDVFRVGGFESRLKFPVCKLIDRLDGDWRDDHSLPVLVARGQIEASARRAIRKAAIGPNACWCSACTT